MNYMIPFVLDEQAYDTVHKCAYKGAQIAEDLYQREEDLAGTEAYSSNGYNPSQQKSGGSEQCKASYSLLMATKVLQKQYAAK